MEQEQSREQHEGFGYRCCRHEHCKGLLGDCLGGTILANEAEHGEEAHKLLPSLSNCPDAALFSPIPDTTPSLGHPTGGHAAALVREWSPPQSHIRRGTYRLS